MLIILFSFLFVLVDLFTITFLPLVFFLFTPLVKNAATMIAVLLCGVAGSGSHPVLDRPGWPVRDVLVMSGDRLFSSGGYAHCVSACATVWGRSRSQ